LLDEKKLENLIIRNMQEGDIDSVARISDEGFNEYYPFDYKKSAELMFLNTKQGYVHVFVAEIEGAVVGYVTLKPWHDGGWIDLIAVEKQSRRSGLAQKLVEYLINEALRRQMRYLTCCISIELTSVKSFWESCGFKLVGTMEKLLSPTHDGFLFYKYIEKTPISCMKNSSHDHMCNCK